MLFHVSIDAHDPRRVAAVIAELWQGLATPFPPVFAGSWIALAGDERGTAIEVYPRGVELHEAAGDADAEGRPGRASLHSATHVAIATRMESDAVFAIAMREGWPAKYRCRGGAFGVIELWIEGTRMVEVLTPDMQVDYTRTLSIEGWMRMVRAANAPAPVTA